MDNEAQQTEDSTPVALVNPTIVTQILGRVLAEGASVTGEGKPNNTRWVLDIEVKKGNDPVVVQLLEQLSMAEQAQ